MRPFLQLNVNQGAEVAEGLTEEPVEKTLSIMELITSGGVGGILIMSVLFVLSIMAVYIFFERFQAIKKANKLDQNFMNHIKDDVVNGKLEAAKSLCKTTDHPIARMVGKGVDRIGKPLTDISASIENQGKIEVQKMEKNLPLLATISGGAPMIGFLGTVIGMILAFQEMAAAGGQVDVAVLAEGSYTAMTTTVAGLAVGIIAYFGYNYLVARIENLIYKIEVSATEFLDLLHEPI
jgi:biopolymer transport protein ExbB